MSEYFESPVDAIDDKTAAGIVSHHRQAEQAWPAYFRMTSIVRLPGKRGKGIYNEATLCHDALSVRVGWHSSSVDTRLRYGCLVRIMDRKRQFHESDVYSVTRIERIDSPVAALNPFALVPPSWLNDRELVRRAGILWERLDRPLQHLVNAVLWDGGRFYRYVTVPVSLGDYPCPAGGNFRQAVDLAEQALTLADDLPDIDVGVLITAALLVDAGKADDFKRTANGNHLQLSERGFWIGCRQTVLEWLAIARTKVILPDALYYRLVHVLIAMGKPPEKPIAMEAAILNVACRFIDHSNVPYLYSESMAHAVPYPGR